VGFVNHSGNAARISSNIIREHLRCRVAVRFCPELPATPPPARRVEPFAEMLPGTLPGTPGRKWQQSAAIAYARERRING
jgi:hypothetical protein